MRLLLLTMLLSAPAYADPAPDAKSMHTDDCARARKQNKTCVIDMGKETIEAEKTVPHGTAIGILEYGKAASLIHIRRDFIVEVLRTAEDL